MKKILKVLLPILLIFSFAISLNAAKFSKMGHNPELIQEGKEKPWCHVCGMSLKMFYKTSHAVILKDGTKRQYCSIRCLVADWPNIKDKVKEILVVDAKSEKLIPAKKAYYVVGSKVKGTMSRVSKIAFAKKEDAESFQKKYGGKIVDFDTAFKIAKENLKKDMAMLQKKKQKMMYPKGKMIYKKMCKKDIDKSKFHSIGELKTYIVKSKVCGNVKGKKLQALALYIWEVKGNESMESKLHIDVPKDAKCPVCGMYVYKYPRWAAEIILKDGKKLYFDGAKDLFKFLLHPSKYGYKNIKIKNILVNDYYHQVAIPAKKAYYVIGSDVKGPMGEELIPFRYKKDAKTFKKDHRGKNILKFEDINDEVLKELE
ncbi:nitrous oxide reductase accessory protein NosL [Nitrosophilus kaiyonis]|uniref:nitrous oxide reductase accessory protein NosL n=1 Tax=Nitrosophilus kaiyonis TaxID=2930200 RepID=UPI00248F4FDF|nr:nitrous oxide reductase accessory protein NosL [Nitrosophilus kaiyonis]